MTVRTLIGAAAVAALAGAASADIIVYDFFLSGEQEVPPTGSPAVGAAEFRYDTDTQNFDLDLMVYGIDLADLRDVGPNGTPIHIHMAPFGQNGPIVVDLGFFTSFVDDGLGIRYQIFGQLLGGQQGNLFTDPNDNEAALFAGNLYVNIHTNDFPSGEIRGQIVPAPAALPLLGAAGVLAARRRR